ncbi:MAG: glycosyltransferase [Proteobacteria bacterium]|nr:glycosyltransferase [Pseudomonadota bacterium]MDA1325365.1 glycosyltransferase [Pseudomonadota bacterium]
MRICMIGKYPPIQGGVSARNYHMAHALAKRGHQVHVVTNAREVELPWRLLMRQEDWDLCEADYGEGSVRVSWTAPMDMSQRFIPRNNPSVTKLASLALAAHKETPFDLIHSFYLEPYGVAGHVVAQALDLPHIVKTAGSDAGKLWHHSQFEPLYDHILSSADLFIASGSVAKRAIDHGIDPRRIVASRGFQLATDLFCPDGDELDLNKVIATALETEGAAFKDLCWGSFRGDRPYVGVYGKLGERKGSFALLDALARARADGADIGLVAMAHGHPDIEVKFRRAREDRGLTDHVLQIPFLPHWRVPSFIRSCLAVCCLEQDFPIMIHNPIVTQEVMSCGGCLIAATELLNKHTQTRQLVSGVNCVAIRDVNDTDELSAALIAAAGDPQKTAAIGARARNYAERFDPGMAFAARSEDLFTRTAKMRPAPPLSDNEAISTSGSVSLTQMALSLLDPATREACLAALSCKSETPEWVAEILGWIQNSGSMAGRAIETVKTAVELDSAIRTVKASAASRDAKAPNDRDPIFRTGNGWVLEDGDLLDLFPLCETGVRLLEFDVQVAPFISARQPADLPGAPETGASHLAVLPLGADQNAVLQLDQETARFLQQCNGNKSARDIAAGLGISAASDLANLAGRLMFLLMEDVLVFRPAVR